MSTELIIVLAVISGIVGISGAIIGVAGWKRNSQNDAKGEARDMGEIIGTLKCVRDDMGKIDKKIDIFGDTIGTLNNKVSVMDGTIQGLVSRVDKLEKRRDKTAN